MAKLWPMLTDYHPAVPGVPYIDAEHDWEWLFTCVTGGWQGRQTPRQVANRFGRMWLHNPGGHDGPPMDLQQMDILTALAEQNPNDIGLRNNTDWDSFTRFASKFSKENRLAIYLGQPQSLPPYPKETPMMWTIRAMKTFQPVLDIRPRPLVAFDATFGYPYLPDDPTWKVLGGRNGGVALMFDIMMKEGFEVMVEPALMATCDWGRDYGWIMTDSFRRKWPDKWYTLKWGRHVPLHPIGYQTGRLLEYVRLKYSDTDEERKAKIRTCLDTGWDAMSQLFYIPDDFGV